MEKSNPTVMQTGKVGSLHRDSLPACDARKIKVTEDRVYRVVYTPTNRDGFIPISSLNSWSGSAKRRPSVFSLLGSRSETITETAGY